MYKVLQNEENCKSSKRIEYSREISFTTWYGASVNIIVCSFKHHFIIKRRTK